MEGLFFLGVVLVWVVLCAWLARRIWRLLPDRPWRSRLTFLIFVALVPMLVIDEIVAAPQFARLCREQARLVLDDPAPSGKTVWFGKGTHEVVSIWPLRATVSGYHYVDVKSSLPTYHYHDVQAKGGFFIRTLGIAHSSPLVFGRSCGPPELKNLDVWIKEAGMNEVPRPTNRSLR
jgi:hypothetical protein